MPILVGIDGTDDSWSLTTARNARYDRDFEKSFVSRLCKGKSNGHYYRGPLADGGYLWQAIEGGVAFIKQKKQQMPNEPVLLTGYSRGALGAVVVAKKLKALNINVQALMMFDCVDRDMANDAEIVPDNVKFVRHVIRNPAAQSRATFGNDGMKYNPSTTNYPPAVMYMCTHGGMGGVPWNAEKDGKKPSDLIDEGAAEAWGSPVRRGPVWSYTTRVTYSNDKLVSDQVWAQCQNFLNTHGFFSVR